ncbi:MAG: BamA/TamA family outer membrane protein, partial [Bacteroidota bacterium]
NRKNGYLEDYLHHFENRVIFNDGIELRYHVDTVLSEKLDSAVFAQIDTVILDTIYKQRAVTHFATNYDRSIHEQSEARRGNRYAELIFRDGKWQIFTGETQAERATTPVFTTFQKQRVRFLETTYVQPPAQIQPKDTVLKKADDEPIDVSDLPVEKQDTGKIDIDNYLFQSEFDEEEIPTRIQPTQPPKDEEETEPEVIQPLVYRPVTEEPTTKKVQQFRSSRIIPYRLKFRTDFVTTQLDNSLLFDGLSTYAGVPEDFGYPPPGILLKANFKDLFEDYEFEGGIRVPTSFNGAEYFLVFKDKKKRLDKQYAVYRRRLRFTEDATPPPLKYENTIFLTQYQVRYPLDIFTSIRGTATLRFDNSTWLATNDITLEAPTQRSQRFGVRGEFVFDNTLDVSLNIKNGTRYKVFMELVKGLDIDLGEQASFKVNDGFMQVIGGDFRHYQRLFRHSILAGRAAAATSFGQEKILYLLGGTDNWLLPQFDETIPLPTGENFAYRSISTNLRGFKMNARNGNSYALVNAELRSPVLRYLFPRTQSNFVRNFQLVGFFDAGTAWQGLNPFNETSPLNTWYDPIRGDNVDIEVNYFRDPIVFGYGLGMRTLLFGYFIRLDYAWGVETRETQDPKLYFSIGMDF